VGGVVIEHQMHIVARGHGLVDLSQEFQELFRTMAGHAIADDQTGLHVECCEYDQGNEQIMIRNMKHPMQTDGNDMLLDIRKEAQSIINSMPRVDDRIFPYNRDVISRHFTDACKILGIEDLHFHDLRHEGISRLFEMGLTIPQAAQVSGHRSWQSLQRYTQIKHSGDKYANWKWWPMIAASS
jgi:integrase